MGKRSLGISVLGVIAVAAVAAAAPATAATKPAASTLPPPPVKILTDTGGNRGGDIFISPYGDTGTYANGGGDPQPGRQGPLVPPGARRDEEADFRTQTYDGKPVLTFWQGTGLGGVSNGVDYIYNDQYQLIATSRRATGCRPTGTSSSSPRRTPR